MPAAAVFPNLMVGTETGDDAAVYRLNDTQAIVATTDFFTPVVDDPFEFGRIAATNALSDIYAMGASPILALAIVGMPVDKMPMQSVQLILAGGASVCAAAGIPVAGGHSIDSAEPIYGLVALGLVHPDRLLRNNTARPGDRLILTKGLGVGVFSAALKQDMLDAAGYATMIASTTQLNRVGTALAQVDGVHAVTDVTGFGLLGHALEMARGAGVTVELNMAEVPLLPGAQALAKRGVRTGAAIRNWSSYGGESHLPEGFADWKRDLLCDPQTSGGLLISVGVDRVDQVLAQVRAAGFERSAVIGQIRAGPPAAMVVG
jgi:selenide,water dikinase